MLKVEILSLDKSFARDDFDCGVAELNSFLKTKARINQKAGFNTTFVMIKRGDLKKKVVGFYSLSMGEISLNSLPEAVRKKLPKHPVPVARMGRLAVDNGSKGHGYGKVLVADALIRVRNAAKEVGVYALVVDAKDDEACKFYMKFGFIRFADEDLKLFLPVGTLKDF